MIGAGLLQPALDVGIEAGPIADGDRRHDRGRLGAPAADALGDDAPRERAHRRQPLVDPPAARDNLHERSALHRPDQRRPPPRELALVIRHTGIEVPRGAAKHHRHPDAASGAPVRHLLRGKRSDDGDENAPARLKGSRSIGTVGRGFQPSRIGRLRGFARLKGSR